VREPTRDFERAQRSVLERIALGDPLPKLLTDIVRLVEGQADGMLCSIVLLDEDGVHVRMGAAPSLPPAHAAMLDGLEIGPTAGSCGAAAFTGQRVIVEDIATHPNWAPYRELALPFGLRACWSSPIKTADTVLGTFAMYYRESRGPTAEEIAWVDAATYLASIAIMRDRTAAEVRRLEANVRKREVMCALIFDCVEDVIFYVGVEGPDRYRFLNINPAFEKATGLTAAQVVGKLVTEVIPPESHALVLSNYARAIATRRKVTWEETSPYPSGVRYGEVAVAPLFGPDGTATNIVGTVHDVTDRRNAEAEHRQMQARLDQAQRLQSLGTLAGGIAHDFNNVLSVILTVTEMMRDGMPVSDPLRADLDLVGTAAVRASEMTRQLLAFSRQQVLEPRVLDLNQALAGMHRMLHRLLGADVELTVLPGSGLANVKADPGQLEQIVMNLAINARDAMPRGGHLTMETASVTLDEDYALAHLEVRPGPYVMLAVSDTGTGMDAQTQARMFEPFFTTKEQGKGTGLGLSTVFGIVKQSGGHISVYSEPGRGTTFKIYLPAVDGAADDLAGMRAAHEPLSGSETILLVEDDDQVRRVVSGVLSRNGYQVLPAANAREALAIADQFQNQIHLLLTDLVLPRMSGTELAQQIQTRRTGVRVLCMSGYTDDAAHGSGLLETGMAFLQKPLTPDSLLRKVREVLH
jgi:PAS domain S-box-containing protein